MKYLQRLAAAFRNSLLLWERPLPAGVLTLLILTGMRSLLTPPWLNSTYPYHNYLADAFLHGQLYLRQVPPITLDLSLYQGRYYLYWGPFPALLAMPWVALFGVQASDILQSLVAGALNVAIFSLLLRKACALQWIDLSAPQRAALVLFFALGTAQAPLIPFGTVWFLSLLQAIAFELLVYLAAFSLRGSRAFWWAGCAAAGILLTRPSAILATIFVAWYLLYTHRELGWRRLVRLIGLGLAPVVAALLVLGVYNFLRFGNPLDNGVAYHLMAEQFKPLAQQYGIFSPHYIPVNLYLNYIDYPLSGLFSGVPHVTMGGSLFLLSPLFLAAPYALWKERHDIQIWLLGLTFLVGTIPALMVMAPGSNHFGPRYLLDVIVPLLLLTARGIRRWPFALTAVMVSLSVLQYLIGTLGVLFSAFR